MRAHGWRVFATARKPEDIERLAGDGFEALHLELADGQSIGRCADAFLARVEGHDLALFNNAAYGQPGAVEDITPAVLRRQLEVNLVGTHDLTRRIIPAMRARASGRIVNCSSVLGFIGAPFRGAYCASKFALEGLTDAMRLELRGSGIRVALIEPGPINTRFVDNALAAARANVDVKGSVHRARYDALIEAMLGGGNQTFKLEPEVVARQVVHACESQWPRRRYKSTLPTHGAGFLKRLLPDALMDWVVARN
jgi:NAD(P)-dependent dehydrogenase (short-subunit alcohol dehydrogenase family)